MAELRTLVIALIIAGGTPSLAAGFSAISLDVSFQHNPKEASGHQVVNCSLDPSETDLETVTSLILYGSSPFGEEGKFDQLAEVNIWASAGKMVDELEGFGISVSGSIGPQSSLLLSSPSNLHRHSYKCVAYGIDRAGEAVSVSTITKPDVALNSLRLELQALSEQVELGVNKSEGLAKDVESVHRKLDSLETKLDAFLLRARVHSTLLAEDWTNFDVSRVYKDRIYLASKREEKAFDFATTDSACVAAGGYLAEIDDDEESAFVLAFSTRLGGSEVFMTGGNDLENEGKFVYFHSKKPVPDHVTWLKGNPSNSGGNEDCMHFWISRNGLNDTPCGGKAKFVCEIPLRPY